MNGTSSDTDSRNPPLYSAQSPMYCSSIIQILAPSNQGAVAQRTLFSAVCQSDTVAPEHRLSIRLGERAVRRTPLLQSQRHRSSMAKLQMHDADVSQLPKMCHTQDI